jgi:hypothetical protein
MKRGETREQEREGESEREEKETEREKRCRGGERSRTRERARERESKKLSSFLLSLSLPSTRYGLNVPGAGEPINTTMGVVFTAEKRACRALGEKGGGSLAPLEEYRRAVRPAVALAK